MLRKTRQLRKASENAEPPVKTVIDAYRHKVELDRVDEERVDRFIEELRFSGYLERTDTGDK